ncbi:MAG: hypothetical protein R3F50_15180 [Gammaproteobacteria bacterium]|jgi:hypothetical protein
MSEKKYSENDPERTLITLDQLSQTIEVMTSVVNRLRKHLSDQITARREIEEIQRARRERERDKSELELCPVDDDDAGSNPQGVVVEVTQPGSELDERPDEKTLH